MYEKDIARGWSASRPMGWPRKSRSTLSSIFWCCLSMIIDGLPSVIMLKQLQTAVIEGTLLDVTGAGAGPAARRGARVLPLEKRHLDTPPTAGQLAETAPHSAAADDPAKGACRDTGAWPVPQPGPFPEV
jgi:hypothetical protein